MKVLLQIMLWFKRSVQCPGKKGGTGGRGQILQKRCVRTIFFSCFSIKILDPNGVVFLGYGEKRRRWQ
jgi:hypothetical protein